MIFVAMTDGSSYCLPIDRFAMPIASGDCR